MEYAWLGSNQPGLDEVRVTCHSNIIVGRYGGNVSSGANKNEDGLLLIQSPNHLWSFAVLLDAHHTAESAELVIETLNNHKESLVNLLDSEDVFTGLEPYFVDLFTSKDFRGACRETTGEASCLIVFQKNQYIWWFSVGDCMALLLHPELARLGQYGLNQRQFYEWIGQVNTFELPVPGYTVGRRQLRPGSNYIVLMTDGVLDSADKFYQDPVNLYASLVNSRELEENVNSVFEHLHEHKTKDSATMICWIYHNKAEGLIPSDQPKSLD
ncbi:protein phosphatase 2C domain-containing protein [Paenibacillus zeisoli]|uniref:Protein phosphatase 2C domain-containing protein n=1 Tax=Paenibacillus zeisoli TaxID=2496267 RepID=A0A433X1M5_9BACL|nr:protein phosphatase 2C domain-containing protein [Paenibacillus zeisoli]RUT28019.1 protein phosphatase 2C domain-containing protein [Paenibacillus zeisoli]